MTKVARTERRRPPHAVPLRVGFTVVEILVTLAIILILVSILIVGLGQVSGTAQEASTRFLLNSMSMGLVQFKNDHGYYPPVLGENVPFGSYPEGRGWARDVVIPDSMVSGGPTALDDRQRWYSITTPSEYLIGYGDRSADGYGIVGSVLDVNVDAPGFTESPPVGFRSPGRDGAWGSVSNPANTGYSNFPGTFGARNPGNVGVAYPADPSDNDAVISGQVFGPYLELKDEDLLAAIRPDGSIARQGDPDYDVMPKVIVDYWGEPIRYYRRGYVSGDPAIDAGELGLEDVFVLRPWTFEAGVNTAGAADAAGDAATTPQLRAAQFGFLSAGADRRIVEDRRVDEGEFNRDNIVEIGQ